MTTNTQHTPTPWKLWNGYGPLSDGKYAVSRIGPATGMFDGLTGSGGADIVGTKDDLEFVAIAVNSFDDLLVAAEAARTVLLDTVGDWVSIPAPHVPSWVEPMRDTIQQLDAAIAIAKAKGEA